MKRIINPLFLYIGIIVIAGCALMLWINSFGASINPDSIVYIGGAASLLSGKGFSINGNPITHFPPLYSVFLAAPGLFKNNLVHAARYLNAILFGINMGLVALAVYLSAGRNFFTSTLAVFFFLASGPLFVVHAYAWSEPLFIALTLIWILLLSYYVIKPTLSLLITSSLFFGLALITRYIGIAFLPPALAFVFVGRSHQQMNRRFRHTIIWLVIACAPLVIFLTRNLLTAGSTVDRSLVFHPAKSFIAHVTSNLIIFIDPIQLPLMLKLAIFGLLAASLIAVLIILFKGQIRSINLRDVDWRSLGVVLPVSCVLFSIFYLLFLYISISFLDASTEINYRIVSPMIVILIAAIFSMTWTLSQKLRIPASWWGFLLIVCLSISIKTPDAIQSVASIQNNSFGYTSQQWRISKSIAYVKTLPADLKIYSNAADVLGFLTDKESLFIPEKWHSTTKLTNPLYNAEIEAMCKDIKENKAVLVYLSQIQRRYLPTQKEIMSTCQLPILQGFVDGTVYSVNYR
ncbi:MAG: hypothetical protein P4L50_12240 [Anaerolineaceae bacterium]|nr:hypothetical protein [Anaerolineaceae bacterium]